MSECWSIGVLEKWSVGVMECWSVGVMEYWSNGVLECWSVGFKSGNRSDFILFYPNGARISYRRVGCAHQISLISSVKGGQSPPYNKGVSQC
jgi:hypothetical protein